MTGSITINAQPSNGITFPGVAKANRGASDSSPQDGHNTQYTPGGGGKLIPGIVQWPLPPSLPSSDSLPLDAISPIHLVCLITVDYLLCLLAVPYQG